MKIMGNTVADQARDARVGIKVADEVWIATALLHLETPSRSEFSVKEIVARAEKENLTGALRPGVYQHANSHCVANRQPDSHRYRMLFETPNRMRRLYRRSDAAHSKRKGKIMPDAADLPENYRYLLDWYNKDFDQTGETPWLSGVWEFAQAGRKVFAGVDADEYVRSLREGWE